MDNSSPAIISLVSRTGTTGGHRQRAGRGMNFFGQRHSIPAALPRLEPLRAAFAEFLQNLGAAPDDVARWELVLSEAATNAILHGSAEDPQRQIEIAWSASDGQVRLEVADGGPGPENHQPPAKLPADPLQTFGRGLYLIHESCDGVEYWRGEAGFRLVMSRKMPGLALAGQDSESILQSALAEISQCYESLAAFYRLGDALSGVERLPEFFAKAAADIAKVVPHDRLSFYFLPWLQTELRPALAQISSAPATDQPGSMVEQVALAGNEFVWQEAGEIAGDDAWRNFACGLCVPLRAGGMILGTLTLARRRQPYLVAAELSTLRTYADVFGIALANAYNALVHEREKSALRELEIAAATQAELLPLPAITEHPGWRAVVRRRCALTVAGDYVDICPTPDGGWMLAMVDVMGKGMSAALFAGMVRTALHIHVNAGQPVDRLIRNLNRALCAQTGELTLFATCALAYITPRMDRAIMVNAGHCPILWLSGERDGLVREFGSSGPPLGLFADTEFALAEQRLEPGDRLVMVTDGLYEQVAPGKDSGNWAGLVETVRLHAREGGEALWKILQQRQYPGGESPTDVADDQTLLAWERTV